MHEIVEEGWKAEVLQREKCSLSRTSRQSRFLSFGWVGIANSVLDIQKDVGIDSTIGVLSPFSLKTGLDKKDKL